MRAAKLAEMTRGWFVGDFEPTLYRTGEVEVAVKTYKAGEVEAAHYHAIATEITVVTGGMVEMNGVRYGPGDVIILEPGEVADFRALTDAVSTVVKIPGAANDKYIPGAGR
ncbi:MAG: hypothetical protein LBV70_04510 [Candidatus Adiutrix sp.]|jgi:quercetin dioxygenase-like cupin family protein|nr:hypothetical protein [Candidatus Adiutrix sp.]